MRDYVEIASAPAEEECAQVGADDYADRSMAECGAFIRQLRRYFGPEPQCARLSVKRFEHDFGAYREVVCYYEEESEASADYAFKCEAECPARWDDIARAELIAAGFPPKGEKE